MSVNLAEADLAMETIGFLIAFTYGRFEVDKNSVVLESSKTCPSLKYYRAALVILGFVLLIFGVL